MSCGNYVATPMMEWVRYIIFKMKQVSMGENVLSNYKTMGGRASGVLVSKESQETRKTTFSEMARLTNIGVQVAMDANKRE